MNIMSVNKKAVAIQKYLIIVIKRKLNKKNYNKTNKLLDGSKIKQNIGFKGID